MITLPALDAAVVACIESHCANTEGVETGGVIVKAPSGGYATGPGPNAACMRHALQWDSSYILGCIETAMALGCDVFGRWHKHPAPIILASEWDRRSAESFRLAIGADSIVDVIVGCDGSELIGWAAYVCDETGHHRAQLELAEGHEPDPLASTSRLAAASAEGSPLSSWP